MARRSLAAGAAAAALLCAAGGAMAHTSYMLPSTFDATDSGFVTIQSSFGEESFAPDIAVDGADFHVLTPSGARAEFDTATTLRQLVVLESELAEDGTYRFTTGERLGRSSVEALKDGEWTVLESADAPLPEGAEGPFTVQTATLADAYVSKGPLTRAAVDATVGALAIRPVTHPNDVFADESFAFDLMLGEAPVANHTLTLYRDGGEYENPAWAHDIVTDAQGHAEVRFDRPGVYLLMTRLRADAPEGAGVDVRSYTTSLTFEVLP